MQFCYILWKGGAIAKFLAGTRKYFTPILIVVLVVCIVVLISSLDYPINKKQTEVESFTPIIVAEVTPAEPVQTQAVSSMDPLSDSQSSVLHQSEEEIPESQTEAAAQDNEQEDEVASADTASDDDVTEGLVTQREEKLDQRLVELEDMKSMLALLEELDNDPKRIELYKNLIIKTEKEIEDLRNDIDRYSSALKE